jgi:hypothetical protein
MRLIALAALLLLTAACGTASHGGNGVPLSVPQLKFAVIDSVGRPVYCDPDFYPVGREEGPNALKTYPEIRADATLYAAIVEHEHLPQGELNDAQKLALYRAFKLLRALELKPLDGAYTFETRVESRSGSTPYQLVDGTVAASGEVSVTKRSPAQAPMCPICLAASTLIATPSGEVLVTAIRPGMLVWTATVSGTRVAARVASIGSMLVPPSHLMVHVVLVDGRELLASPGHRTADGRPLGSLTVGDTLDGSLIQLWELVPYAADRTYDLLPEGPTGEYWANGILLWSTLSA